jgi:hypothetical protein
MVGIFKKVDLISTLVAGAAGAILFCIPVVYYILSGDYQKSGWLYIGSFLFMIVMWVHTIRESKKRENNESTVALVFASLMATIAGIIFSCLLCLLLLILLVPGYLQPGEADKVLAEAPANIIKDKTDGLSFSVFMAAIVINFSVGSFTAIILPFYLKKNQTRDSRTPAPLHQRGKK